MAPGRTAALLGLLGTLTTLSVGGAAAADLHRRHHVRRHYVQAPAVVPLGYAYGGYQRAYPPGYGYVVPGQGYDGQGFGFPGY